MNRAMATDWNPTASRPPGDVAHWSEHPSDTRKVDRFDSVYPHSTHALMVQGKAHLITDQKVGSSNLSGGALS